VGPRFPLLTAERFLAIPGEDAYNICRYHPSFIRRLGGSIGRDGKLLREAYVERAVS
jgi:hypothetical protein